MDPKEVEDELDTPTIPSDNELHQPCDSYIFQVGDQGGSMRPEPAASAGEETP